MFSETPRVATPSRWPLWVSLIAVVGVFILRLPGIVQPMGPDQGLYATIAWCMQRGLALYRDLFEQKPPGLFLTYRLGFALFGSRTSAIFWLDYLAGAGTVLVLFDLGRRLVSLRFGALTAALAAFATLPAARYANGGFVERSVTEPFVTLFASAAAWAAVRVFMGRGDSWTFAAGLFVGVAVLYKQTALIYLPALALWMLIATDFARGRRFALYASAGVVVPPLLAFIWLWLRGVLADAWITLVEYNVAYLAVGDHGLGFTVNRFAHEVWRRVTGDEVWAVGTVGAVAAVWADRWRSTAAGRAASLGIVWLAAALTATVANGPRVFTTYFTTSLAPLSLLSAWLFHQTLGSGGRRKTAIGLAALAFAAGMIVRSGSMNRLVSSTAWDTRHLLGQTGRQEYLQRFRSRSAHAFSAADNERLADYIRAHTDARDRLFVFGMAAGTYFSSGRLPASSFLFAYPAVSNMIDQPRFSVEALAAELVHTAPRYIVLQRHNGDEFSGWHAMDSFAAPPMVALLRNYRQETEIGDFVLYRRSDREPELKETGVVVGR